MLDISPQTSPLLTYLNVNLVKIIRNFNTNSDPNLNPNSNPKFVSLASFFRLSTARQPWKMSEAELPGGGNVLTRSFNSRRTSVYDIASRDAIEQTVA